MNHPKSGQTCHADKTEQKHEGEKALHTMELQDYNHDIDSKQEENTMALRADLLKTELRLVEEHSPSKTVLHAMPATKAEAYKLAEKALRSQTPKGRLAVMRQYILDSPNSSQDEAEYLQLLERLVQEEGGDYSNPVTAYGCLIHFRSLSEDEFIQKLQSMELGCFGKPMPEIERRKAHRAMLLADVPELPREERAALYNWGDERTPSLRRLFIELLEDPAANGNQKVSRCGHQKVSHIGNF